MKTFLYKVKNNTGRTLWGVLEARDRAQVKKHFRSTEFYLLSIHPTDTNTIFRRRIRFEALLMFTHRFTSLLEAGIPIISILNILWRQSEDKDLQIIVSHLKKKLESGSNLKEALDGFPNVFPPLYRVMVGVAEIGAGLVPVFRKLTQYLDHQKEVITKAKRATLYPSLVIVFALLVLMGMFMFVIPSFEKVLDKLNVELPLLTVIILAISNFMRSWAFPIVAVGGGAILFVLYKVLRSNERTAYMLDAIRIRMPVFGPISYMFSISRLVRALSLMIGSGVSLVQSLDIAKKTAGNRKIEAAMEDIKREVSQGDSLYDAFQRTNVFPLILVEMIGIGEKSGKLSELMNKTATHFEEELDYTVNKFLTFLEPILILFVGGIVLITILGIYLPLISIWNNLR